MSDANGHIRKRSRQLFQKRMRQGYARHFNAWFATDSVESW